MHFCQLNHAQSYGFFKTQIVILHFLNSQMSNLTSYLNFGQLRPKILNSLESKNEKKTAQTLFLVIVTSFIQAESFDPAYMDLFDRKGIRFFGMRNIYFKEL